MQNTVIVKGRQTLFDISIQCLGSIEGVFELAAINGLSVTDILPVGSELKLPTIINSSVVEYFAANQLSPASDSYKAKEKGIGEEYISNPEPVFTVE